MSVSERFRNIRHHLGLSQPEMSSWVGLSRNAWQSYELNKSSPGTGVYQRLLGHGFSVDWLLSGAGQMLVHDVAGLDGYVFLPLYAAIASAGAGGSYSDNIVDWLAFKKDWILMELRAKSENLAVIIAEGDSMIPTISPGDMLLVDNSRRSIVGDGIYVLTMMGSCLVKRMQVLVDGSVKLISDNPAYAEQTVSNDELSGLSVAGRVVWHGHRV